ncbi:hypothetical protein [Marinomonas epiphytica]
MMKGLMLVSVLLVSTSYGQTVEVVPVDIIYGTQVIRGQHQVVKSSPEKVTIIPVEQAEKPAGVGNLVVSASGQQLSYLEQSQVADREQEIYDEVNRRTKENPFTVLFTGRLPDDIQEKRIRMMAEVGVFGDYLDEQEVPAAPDSEQDASNATESVEAELIDPGAFSEVAPIDDSKDESTALTDEQRLEQLIGG